MSSIYDPASYPSGVESPYGPRVHAYPTRYHGPNYDRVQPRLTFNQYPLWRSAPLSGGCTTCAMGAEEPDTGPSPAKIAVAIGLTVVVVAGALWLGPKLARAS